MAMSVGYCVRVIDAHSLTVESIMKMATILKNNGRGRLNMTH
ncbi:protein of unknown function [Shewanella benthica]|uniref:Uncharacterized protein n=1 Tax=Shewanella benthica TaxID=43661 RepID=A0A330M5F7_9GAMM|nr:protein of unknown function [Shewanella benthica]